MPRPSKLRLGRFARVTDINRDDLPWKLLLPSAPNARYYEIRAMEEIAAGRISEAQQYLALAKWKAEEK